MASTAKANNLKTPCPSCEQKFHIKLHGMVTVGPKGQIVIPASARKELGIEVGDQLMTIVKFGKVVGFFKANVIEELEAAVMNEIKYFKSQL